MLAAGCDGYIAKPIDTRAFAAQIAAALRGKRRRPSLNARPKPRAEAAGASKDG